MSKKSILLACFFYLVFNSYGNETELVFIKKIPIGSDEGLIGYGGRVGGWIIGPKGLGISINGKIYVPDEVNKRINIYDININYIDAIKATKETEWIPKTFGIKTDKYGNIIFFSSDHGIMKLNENGGIIYHIAKEKLSIRPDSISINVIDNYLFFYDLNGYVHCIDEKGDVSNNAESLQILERLSTEKQNEYSSDQTKAKKQISKDKKKIVVGDRYYPRFSDDFKQYIKTKKSINKTTIDIKAINFGGPPLAYDKEHNSYWSFSQKNDYRKGGILVFSQDGDILAAIYTYNLPFIENIVLSNGAISPLDGTMYFMECDGKFYYFYKIPRTW